MAGIWVHMDTDSKDVPPAVTLAGENPCFEPCNDGGGGNGRLPDVDLGIQGN